MVKLTNLHLLEEVEHSHAHHNDQEGPQCGDHVHRGHTPPLLEEDDGGGQHHRGEEDVVDGVDQLGVEGVQWLVQVVHLWQNTQHTTEPQHQATRAMMHLHKFLQTDLNLC